MDKPLMKVSDRAIRDKDLPNGDSSNRRGWPKTVRQVSLTWATALLTLILFALTARYALTSDVGKGAAWLRSSPSRPILLLRVLSEATSISLFLLISSVLERLQWMLISQEGGIDLPTLLSMEPGTGVLGLLQLLFQKSLQVSTRLSSIVRLALKFVVPALAVLIMSNVRTEMHPSPVSTLNVTAGIDYFDASFAVNQGSMLPSIFMMDISHNFLQTTSRVAPIEPFHKRQVPCPPKNSQTTLDSCSRSYFLTGGLDGVSPWPFNTIGPEDADIYIVESLRGIQLDLMGPLDDLEYDPQKDCRIYTQNNFAIQICIWPTVTGGSGNTPLNAKLVNCPVEVSAQNKCTTDTTWYMTDGYNVSVFPSARYATTIFARNNGSILAVDSSGQPSPSPVDMSAQDILDIYDLVFNPTDTASIFTAGTLIDFMWETMTVGNISSSGVDGIGNQFANLLALPLLYFQANYQLQNNIIHPHTPREGLSASLHTKAFLAKTSYNIVVGRPTAIIYIIGGSVVIFACVAVLVLGSLPRFAGDCPELTQWPAFDLAAKSGIKNLHTGEPDDLKACGALKGRDLRKAVVGKVVVSRDAT